MTELEQLLITSIEKLSEQYAEEQARQETFIKNLSKQINALKTQVETLTDAYQKLAKLAESLWQK